MVVLTDSQPTSPTKTHQTWSQSQPGSSRAGPSSPRSPPSGVVRSPVVEIPGYQPPPAYVPSPGAPLLPGPQQKPRPKVAKRFCSALAVAVVIVIAFNILGSIFGSIMRHSDPYEWDNNPREEDGNVLTCDTRWFTNGKSNEPIDSDLVGQYHIPAYPVFSASEAFDLPINSSLHYLLARGSQFSGAAIIRGDEGADPNIINVNVTVRYSTQHALARAKVCRLEKPEGAVGVGIYTPQNRIEWGNENYDKLYFLVTVTVPTSRKSLLNLNAFDTNLPNFRHKFERLGDRVQFEHLSVKGTNSVIQADSLYVSQATLKSTNGAINGQFNATDSLVLQTTNGAVDVDVGLTNDDTHRASSLKIESSNGRIESRISLLTTHDLRPQPKGGHFSVSTKTSNGKLDVRFPTTPVDSLLDFGGQTSNAGADVSLHSSFEGTFEIKTSSGRAEIDNGHVSDPTGRGRRRVIDIIKSSKTETKGKTLWAVYGEPEKSEIGQACIKTSNGLATLRLH